MAFRRNPVSNPIKAVPQRSGTRAGIIILPEKKDLFLRLLSTNILTQKKVQQITGITSEMLRKAYRNDPEFQAAVEFAHERRLAELVDAQFKRGSGMVLKTQHVSKMKDKSGKVLAETFTESAKDVAPSPAAARLILSNQLGWTLDGGNGGKDDSATVEYDIREKLYEGENDDSGNSDTDTDSDCD